MFVKSKIVKICVYCLSTPVVLTNKMGGGGGGAGVEPQNEDHFILHPEIFSPFWDFFIFPWAHWFYRFHRWSQIGGSPSKGFFFPTLDTLNLQLVTFCGSLIFGGSQPLGKLKKNNMMKTLDPLEFIWFYRGPTPRGCIQRGFPSK